MIHYRLSSAEDTEPEHHTRAFCVVNFDPSHDEGEWKLFSEFEEILSTSQLGEVGKLLLRAEAAQKAGYYVVGFLSYEAASALNPTLITNPPDDLSTPLVWFGICKNVTKYSELPIHLFEALDRSNTCKQDQSPSRKSVDREESQWTAEISEQAYRQSFLRIQDHIMAGDSYQTNFSFALERISHGNLARTFERLCVAQQAGYSAWIHTSQFDVLSISPELFFKKQDDKITMRPMKGTRPRGRTTEEDRRFANQLAMSSKDRAENVMIVDLIRNDIGKIAEVGSVQVNALFQTEIYPTLIQMTSEVTAILRSEVSLLQIFKSLFPCGSVTGAPKVKTMELIATEEKSPRGVYCGAIGYLDPSQNAVFNVPIRTMVRHRNGVMTYRVGSGVVAESTCGAEYQECLLKSKVLNLNPQGSFQIIETLRYLKGEGFYLRDYHLDRMRDSAEYFNFSFDEIAIRQELARCCEKWRMDMRVRVLLDHHGQLTIESTPLSPMTPGFSFITMADRSVHSENKFLYHKTTLRSVYEDALKHASPADDVILFNERDEITESTIANVAIKIQNDWVTPPISCGLLAGTMRRLLLEKGEIREGIISVEAFLRADQIMLFNSVRGCYFPKLLEICERSIGQIS